MVVPVAKAVAKVDVLRVLRVLPSFGQEAVCSIRKTKVGPHILWNSRDLIQSRPHSLLSQCRHLYDGIAVRDQRKYGNAQVIARRIFTIRLLMRDSRKGSNRTHFQTP